MIIYTDGACQGNGKDINKGGFGVVVLDNDENLLYNYNRLSENTTNNREELKAIIYSLLNYGVNITKETDFDVEIPVVYSDSAYAVNTLTNWMFNWANNNWIKSDKKTPENLDIIQEYYNLYQKGWRIELKKVVGHSGNKWNELADRLATGKITPEEAMKIYG